MEKILELARKQAEAAEVYTVASEETSVHFEANRLKNIQEKQSTTTYLRIIKNGRTGYAVTSGEVNEADLVAMAVETTQFGQEARFEFPSAVSYPQVAVYDKAVSAVPLEQMIKLVEEMIVPLRGQTSDIVCGGGAGRGVYKVNLVNSRGGAAGYTKSVFSLGIEGTVVRGTDMLFVGDSESSCHPLTDSSKIIKTALRQLEYSKNQAQVASKAMPVVLTPDGVASALISALVSAFNGKTVLEGASPIGNRIGEQVFDAKFSLLDDATVPYEPESRPCDDEGVPSRRTPLVENGVVRNFLYDLQTAALAGKQSTGNGTRGRGLPAPSPAAFIIAAGDTTYEDMVKDISEGLVIEQLMGAEQGNVLGGDFSGNVLLGYKIENGKIAGRVKDTMVSGNIYQLLNNITALSRETKWVGGLQTPYMYLPELSVSSK